MPDSEKRSFDFFKFSNEARAKFRKDKPIASWIPYDLVFGWKKGSFKDTDSVESYQISEGVRYLHEGGKCFEQQVLTVEQRVYVRRSGIYQFRLKIDAQALLRAELDALKARLLEAQKLALDELTPDVTKELVKHLLKSRPLLKAAPYLGDLLDAIDQLEFAENLQKIVDGIERAQKEIEAARKKDGIVIIEFDVEGAFQEDYKLAFETFFGKKVEVGCTKKIRELAEGDPPDPIHTDTHATGKDFAEEINDLFDPETGEKDADKRRKVLKKRAAEELAKAKTLREKEQRLEQRGLGSFTLDEGTMFKAGPVGLLPEGVATVSRDAPSEAAPLIDAEPVPPAPGDLVLQIDPRIVGIAALEGRGTPLTLRLEWMPAPGDRTLPDVVVPTLQKLSDPSGAD